MPWMSETGTVAVRIHLPSPELQEAPRSGSPKPGEDAMSIDPALLGKRLKSARTNCGATQEDAAKELGIPRTARSKY